MKHVVTAAPLRQCVLVTGFGAFPGARTNPTGAILRDLARQTARLARLGIALRCEPIPVVYDEIEGALERAAAHRPDAVLHLGLAGRRRHICVETRAINRAGPLHPDAARRLPAGQTLVPGGPADLGATYPASRILAALRHAGLPARRSIDAGDYVCNATLYRSLSARLAPQVGFLHVPRPRDPSRPKRGPGLNQTPKPDARALSRAALLAVLVMARRHPPRTARRPAAPTALPTDAAPADRPPR